VLQSKVHQPETEPPVRSLTLQGFEINNVADVSINKLFATEETKKTDSENQWATAKQNKSLYLSGRGKESSKSLFLQNHLTFTQTCCMSRTLKRGEDRNTNFSSLSSILP
jgi:hypothetical protein